MTDSTLTTVPVETVTTVTTTVVTQAVPADEDTHAQAVPVAAGEEEFFPGHPARLATSEYRATHHHLVNVLDMPCEVCGVRQSTLSDPAQNPHQATAIETHHYPIQRELADACDYKKVARDFGKYVVDQASFLKFVDSPMNIKCLCSYCHRSEQAGIHHSLVSDWAVRPYLLDGYVLNDTKDHAAADIAKDNAIVDAAVPLSQRI